MATKRVSVKTSEKKGIEFYLKRIFAYMTGAIFVTALTTFFVIYGGGINLLMNSAGTGLSATYYIIVFGGLGLSLWAQARAFSMKPQTALLLLGLYSVLMGFALTPLIWASLAINPASILQAFLIAGLMFGCMAMFGYKTVKDLSFLGVFLFIGMIGLIITGVVSMIWPLGHTMSTIVCLIGVLIFALFTAYDMQNLKKSYAVLGDDMRKDQLAVLGALHLYISFVAMFQYVLSLLNNR